jgi:hypothetical protein
MGIPLALVTGDEEVVKEVEAFGCGTVGVAVKRGLYTRQRCITLHPVEARRRIREAAARAATGRRDLLAEAAIGPAAEIDPLALTGASRGRRHRRQRRDAVARHDGPAHRPDGSIC